MLSLQEAAADLTRVQTEKNSTIQTLQQLLSNKEHEVQVRQKLSKKKKIKEKCLKTRYFVPAKVYYETSRLPGPLFSNFATSLCELSSFLFLSLFLQALENSKAWASQENEKLINKLRLTIQDKDKTIAVSRLVICYYYYYY